MAKIHKGEFFCELKIYSGVGSSLGFLAEMLSKLKALCDASLLSMSKPRGFHIVLEDVNSDRLSCLSRIISRWSARRARCEISHMNGKYCYLRADEVRPRTGEFHIHLHFIVDSVQYDDLVYLKQALMPISSRVKIKYRKETCRPLKIDKDTGEIACSRFTGQPLRDGSTWFHDLNSEFSDYFERASYICKLKTKVDPGSWSSSGLPV